MEGIKKVMRWVLLSVWGRGQGRPLREITIQLRLEERTQPWGGGKSCRAMDVDGIIRGKYLGREEQRLYRHLVAPG